MISSEVAVVGAGPYGLAATAHLRRAGVDVRLFGEPMSFWRTMPKGMLLRSNRTATSIAEHCGPLSLDSYAEDVGEPVTLPYPLHRFLDYGSWVQRKVAEDVDRRHVAVLDRDRQGFTLDLADGERVRARRVVVATGIASFVHRPAVAAGLPPDLVSHTSEHRDLAVFSGRRVLVVGGGQSALESAALLRECDTDVEVVVRARRINWLHGGKYHRKLGRLAPLVYAPTDVGPMGLSRLVAVPNLFGRLPRGLQEPLAYRAVRPAGAAWLLPRLRAVPIRLAAEPRSIVPVASGGVRVAMSDGTETDVDHVLLGTGYRVDIEQYSFLAPGLASGVARAGGYPLLKAGLESSVPGLHFVGAPAAWTFGPIMRFVAGSWYASSELTRIATGHRSAAAPARSDLAAVE
ncbi:FAD-dependent oxidoreductase [Pseudonocardia lutea]|uniref:FAD-dependent oxidoreductase n=1 Tax=Pseudonocardia lutea TaxID=2172015 RepID=A0ABW1IF25_9PSEU